MPLYTDPGYFYSTRSTGEFTSPYSSGYYSVPSPYVVGYGSGGGYSRGYSSSGYSTIPTLSSYSTPTTSSVSTSRYQPKLSTITETPMSRGLIPLTRLNSPKSYSTSNYHHHHHQSPISKYIPPRPININTADIDVSASRYRSRDIRSSPKTSCEKSRSSPSIDDASIKSSLSPPTSIKQSHSIGSIKNDQPNQLQQQQQTQQTSVQPKTNDTVPIKKSTIKRDRAVVRLSTIRSKTPRDRTIAIQLDEKHKQNIDSDIEDDRKKSKIESINSAASTSLTSWRDRFGDELGTKSYNTAKKSPGELLLERYFIPSNKHIIDETNLSAKSEQQVDEILMQLDEPLIRRLSIPKCPNFQDFCEDISSDKIDDDLNAGELRRRASIIQEQGFELLNKLQKSSSGSFQMINLERNASGSDLSTGSTKRKSLKKPKKIRHKITATVDVQNQLKLTPIIQELSEDDPTVTSTMSKTPDNKNGKPKFTFNVDEIEENHTVHKIFKLPKKKSSPTKGETDECEKKLEKIETKNAIKDSPKKIKIVKKLNPSKGVKSEVKIDKVLEKITNVELKLEAKKMQINDVSLKPKKVDEVTTTKVKTPVLKKKPIIPNSLKLIKSESEDEPQMSSSLSKTSALTSPNKISSPQHFKFDEESIKKTQDEIQFPGKSEIPISPLAYDRTKSNEKTPPLVILRNKQKTSVQHQQQNKIQKSDSGEDFWSQIGSRETFYMTNRKKILIEELWQKRECLLDDSETLNSVKNLDEIKSIVHDQKITQMKKVDEQTPTDDTKRAHSNESALCDKRKGALKEIKSDDLINLHKSEIPESLKITDQSKSPIKISDFNKKCPLQLPPPATSPPTDEKQISIIKKQQQNMPKIATGLKAKSPEIKSKEIISSKNNIFARTQSPPPPPLSPSAAKLTTKLSLTNNSDATVEISTENSFNSNAASVNDSVTATIQSGRVIDKKQKQQDEQFAPKSVETNAIACSSRDAKKKIDENKNRTMTTTNESGSPTAATVTITTKIDEKKRSLQQQQQQLATSLNTLSQQKLPETSVTTTSTTTNIAATSSNDEQQTQTQQQSSNSNNKKLSDSSTTPERKKFIGKIPAVDKINDANSTDKKMKIEVENKKIFKNDEGNKVKSEEQQKQKEEKHEKIQIQQQQQHNNDDNFAIDVPSNLSKFATVSNLNQVVPDVVDATILATDQKSTITEFLSDKKSEENNSDSSYSSDNGSDTMKRKDKKQKHKQQGTNDEEGKKSSPPPQQQFNRNVMKLDHTKKLYVRQEFSPFPLIATPRPLWKKEKFIMPSSSSESESESGDDDDEDDDESGSEDKNKNGDKKKKSSSGQKASRTSSSSTSSGDDDVDGSDDELNPNKSAIIRMSTCSNDSGFEGGTAPSSPKKMLGCVQGEARDSPSTPPSHNPAYKIDSNVDDETSYTYAQFQKSGRITAPAINIPRFKKYSVEDFHFLTVLGKGSFGKVLLAELRNTEYYYAVKCLKKDVVLEDDDVECTLIERKVLALGTKHPYLCHLFCTFQTESHLFFVMEYLNGGDLMFHIQHSGRFPEPRARFYAAEIISGLKFLHKKGIIYRDLKLDNVLLDFEGHVRIADFGMCKLQIYLDKTADSFCGTPDYMAPEIIKGENYNQMVDWWSFGVLLYEMLIGQSPFSGCDEEYLFWSICNEMPMYPLILSQESTSLLKALLEKDASKRIGSQYGPAGDICYHPFFNQIEWDRLDKRQIEPPFKPQVKHPLDTQYFDKTFTRERVRLTPIDKDILQSMDQAQFQGFSYTNPNATLE